MLRTTRRIAAPKKPKRGRGERAGLTRDAIVLAALEVSEHHVVSLASLAQRLRVTPAAIGAYFEDGLSGLYATMTREALAELAASNSGRDWRADFRQLFVEVGETLRERPHLALWVGATLSTDPVLSPHLTERILNALDHAGVRPRQTIEALDLAMGGLIGFVRMAFSPVEPTEAPDGGAGVVAKINDLPKRQFPHLMAVSSRLARHALARPASNNSRSLSTLAGGFAEATIAAIDQLRSHGA